MSSLWTPGGEVPLGPERPQNQPPGAPPAGAPDPERAVDADEAAMREQIEALRQRMLEAPAADVVVEHLAGVYELAVLHLSQPQPRFSDARLAIDTIAAVVDTLGNRLGEATDPLRSMVHQLRMAFVERQSQTGAEDS